MHKFSTFDNGLVDFLKSKGIDYVKTFIGSSKDTGYEYDYIQNLKEILAEYRTVKPELITEKYDNFEDMLQKFLKDSKNKNNEAQREHTKSERDKKKSEINNRRKIKRRY